MPIRVENRRTGALVAERAAEARSFFARLRGLIGRDPFQPGEGLHLVPCHSIHTFFMREPIDALFLDASFRVVRVISSLSPWSVAPVCREASSVLELPAGTVERTRTSAGDELVFELC